MELTAAQRAYIKKRSKYEEPGPDEVDAELNIVPFLDITVNLIMFLLILLTTIGFYTQVETTLPAGGRSVGRRAAEAEEEALNLSVTLTENGIIVAGSGGKLAPGCTTATTGAVMTIPKANGHYDWQALRNCVAVVKEHFADETQVKVSADPLVEYQNLIAAIDAVREKETGAGDLFPDVLLSAGVR